MGIDKMGFEEGREGAQGGLLTLEEEGLALRLARMTLEGYLGGGNLPSLEELALEGHGIFLEKRAVFVSLHRGKKLRGCIGHIEPVEPLWKSIRSNTVSAAVHDSRFAPVTLGELDGLELEVSVLTPPASIDDPLEFEVGRDGIIMELGHFRAVFLPQVALEQGWNQQTTLEHLSRKAGLDSGGWRKPGTKFEVFQAQIVK